MVYTSRFDSGFNPLAFYRRRLLRIYPIYWFCITLYLAAGWLVDQPYELDMSEFVGALLLLPANAATIIGPAWTLAYEMFFYLAFGLAMTAGLNRGMITLSIAFFALIVSGIFVEIENSAWHLMSNALLGEFLAGAAIGWLYVRGLLPKRWGKHLIFISCILFLAGIALGYDRVPSVVAWALPSTLLIAGAIIIESAKGPARIIRKLGHFGDSSYALYLIHIVVITFFIALAHQYPLLTRIEPAIMTIPIAIVALLLAEFLHHGIERPFLQLVNPHRPLIPVDAETKRHSALECLIPAEKGKTNE